MSWSAVKTEAIVLTVSPTREADRRYRALTPAHGKIDFLGRGAQKVKAKLAAHLEPFAVVDLEVIKGKKSTTVISVDRKKAFRGIAADIDKRMLAHASLALLDRYTYEAEDDPALYAELMTWLHFLDNGIELKPARSTFLLGGFLLRCLSHLGYDVQLKNCVGCKCDVLPLAYRWHAGKGGLVCSDCTQADREEWFAARPLEEGLVKFLRFARDAAYEDLMKPALKGEVVEAYAKLVQDLIFFHIPHRSETPFWQGILAEYALDIPEQKE